MDAVCPKRCDCCFQLLHLSGGIGDSNLGSAAGLELVGGSADRLRRSLPLTAALNANGPQKQGGQLATSPTAALVPGSHGPTMWAHPSVAILAVA